MARRVAHPRLNKSAVRLEHPVESLLLHHLNQSSEVNRSVSEQAMEFIQDADAIEDQLRWMSERIKNTKERPFAQEGKYMRREEAELSANK